MTIRQLLLVGRPQPRSLLFVENLGWNCWNCIICCSLSRSWYLPVTNVDLASRDPVPVCPRFIVYIPTNISHKDAFNVTLILWILQTDGAKWWSWWNLDQTLLYYMSQWETQENNFLDVIATQESLLSSDLGFMIHKLTWLTLSDRSGWIIGSYCLSVGQFSIHSWWILPTSIIDRLCFM